MKTLLNVNKNWFVKILGVIDHKSEVNSYKNKMSDWICRTYSKKKAEFYTKKLFIAIYVLFYNDNS